MKFLFGGVGNGEQCYPNDFMLHKYFSLGSHSSSDRAEVTNPELNQACEIWDTCIVVFRLHKLVRDHSRNAKWM